MPDRPRSNRLAKTSGWPDEQAAVSAACYFGALVAQPGDASINASKSDVTMGGAKA
jgi:hypothetical protein